VVIDRVSGHDCFVVVGTRDGWLPFAVILETAPQPKASRRSKLTNQKHLFVKYTRATTHASKASTTPTAT
jgi:hypothetical protein